MSGWYLLALVSSWYDWKAFAMLINHHNYTQKVGEEMANDMVVIFILYFYEVKCI